MSLRSRSFRHHIACAIGTVVVGVLAFARPAFAGSIVVDTWYEFSFDLPGTPATGCDPADPAGGFCLPSSGTPTTFLSAPPWTFSSGATGSTLTVTDAFLAGDRFNVFDFGVSIGLTSVPVGTLDCGDDPVPCLADPAMSHRAFSLASGNHSITVTPVLSQGGSGYLLLQNGGPSAVPEPATLVLVASGAATALYRRRRRS